MRNGKSHEAMAWCLAGWFGSVCLSSAVWLCFGTCWALRVFFSQNLWGMVALALLVKLLVERSTTDRSDSRELIVQKD